MGRQKLLIWIDYFGIVKEIRIKFHFLSGLVKFDELKIMSLNLGFEHSFSWRNFGNFDHLKKFSF